MQRDAPFLNGQIYHVYNRGAHKANIFLEESDYNRFKFLLFLANSLNPFPIRDTLKKYKSQGRSLSDVFLKENPNQGLVAVLSYTLMPNHFHLILQQKVDGGVTLFMKKVATAYSMYFNTLYDHSGTVFQGRFKSKYVDTSEYLRWLFAYVALNPLDLGFPGWKEKGVDSHSAYGFLSSYQHASFPDLCEAERRPESTILAHEVLRDIGDDALIFSDIHELFEVEQVSTEDRPRV